MKSIQKLSSLPVTGRTFLVGLPGAGKTTIANAMYARGFKVLHLDLISGKYGSKWLVNIHLLKRELRDNPDLIVEGVASNMDQVLALDWDNVVYINPTLEAFRAANKAKARDYRKMIEAGKVKPDNQWIEDWERKGKLSAAKFAKLIFSDREKVEKKAKAKFFVFNRAVRPDLLDGPGWTQPRAKASTEFEAFSDGEYPIKQVLIVGADQVVGPMLPGMFENHGVEVLEKIPRTIKEAVTLLMTTAMPVIGVPLGTRAVGKLVSAYEEARGWPVGSVRVYSFGNRQV